MTTLERPHSSVPVSAPERATGRHWLAVAAVSLGVFVVMTSEVLPIGLLSPIGADLGVSAGASGLLLTVPGLVAAIAAPLSTVLTGRADRRKVLLGLAVLVAAANFGAAMAPSLGAMLAARVLVGFSIGAFWSVAGGIALRLVPEASVPRATAAVFGGIGAATVLGVPLGTWIGDLLGWRASMVALGGLALVALVAIWALVPKLPSTGTVRFASLPRMVRGNRGVRTGLALTFLIVSGHFVAFTFISPILRSEGVGSGEIGALLMGFGVAALAATFVSGSLIGRRLRPTLIGLAAAMALAMGAMALVVDDAFSATAALVLWGAGYGLVSPAVQTWYLKAAPGEAEVATSLNTSMFNLSIAVGSFAGGLVVDAWSTDAVLWIGALLLIPVVFLVRRR